MSEDNDKLELEVHYHELQGHGVGQSGGSWPGVPTPNATYHHKHPNSFVYVDGILVHDHKETPPVSKPE